MISGVSEAVCKLPISVCVLLDRLGEELHRQTFCMSGDKSVSNVTTANTFVLQVYYKNVVNFQIMVKTCMRSNLVKNMISYVFNTPFLSALHAHMHFFAITKMC